MTLKRTLYVMDVVLGLGVDPDGEGLAVITVLVTEPLAVLTEFIRTTILCMKGQEKEHTTLYLNSSPLMETEEAGKTLKRRNS